MKKRLHILLGLCVLLSCLSWSGIGTGFAQTPNDAKSEIQVEERARVVGRSLRCVVCQNQSIDDSNAPLAADMRVMVRDRIRAGDTNAQTVEFMRERYGDFVLLKPPLQANTLLLWVTPIGLLLVLLLWYGLRNRRSKPLTTSAPLSEDERAQFEALIHKTEPTE